MSHTQQTLLWSGLLALGGFGVFQFVAADATAIWVTWVILALAGAVSVWYFKPPMNMPVAAGTAMLVITGLVSSWFLRPQDGFLITDWLMVLSVWLALGAANYVLAGMQQHETIWHGGAAISLLVLAGIVLNISLVESFAFALTGLALGGPAVLSSFKF